MLIGLGIGAVYHFTSTPVYSSTLVCNIPFLKRSEVEQLIATLDNYMSENNVTQLATALHLEGNVVNALTKTELANDKSTASPDSHSYIIHVKLTDPSAFQAVQSGIVFYVSNNPQAKRMMGNKKAEFESAVQSLVQQQTEIDSVLTGLQKSSNVSAWKDVISFSDLSKLKSDLKKEQIELEAEMRDLSSISIVQQFPQYQKASNKNLLKTIAIAVAGSCFLAFAIIATIEILKVVKSQEAKLKGLRVVIK